MNASAEEIDPNFPKWMLGIVVLQTLNILVGLKCCCLFVVIFRQREIFHRNLNLLMFNWIASWTLTMVCRGIICLAALVDWRLIATPTYRVMSWPLVYVDCLKVVGLYTNAGVMGAILFERTVATIFLQIYEKVEHFRPFLLLNVACWVYGMVAGWSAFDRASMTSFGSLSLVFISVFIAVAYAYTFYTNKKRLRESKRACLSTHYSLSEQFQLHENLHMLKVIGNCTRVFLVMIAFNVASWAAIVYLIPDQMISKFYFLREVRVLAGTLTSNAMLYAIITGTGVWRKGLWALLKQLGGTLWLNEGETRVVPRTNEPTTIEFDPNLRSALYFSQLHKAWS